MTSFGLFQIEVQGLILTLFEIYLGAPSMSVGIPHLERPVPGGEVITIGTVVIDLHLIDDITCGVVEFDRCCQRALLSLMHGNASRK